MDRSPSSRSGGSTRRSKPSTCSSLPRRSAPLEMVEPTQVHRQDSPSPPSPAIPPPPSTTSSCRSTTPTRSMATSPRRWSTSTTASPATTRTLDRLGISVKGAIVIARYGAIVARHQAQGRGRARRGRLPDLFRPARGRLLRRATVFPDGPFRPTDGAQRGSVMDMPVYPGDPLTPGVGATKDAKRLPLSEVKTLTKIPVLPISYGDAQPLLAALKGPVAPAAWRGALPITYHVGPGPAKVHLKLKFNWDTKPLYDVIARIPGSQLSRRVDHPRQPSRRLGQRRGRSGLRRGRRDGRERAPGRAAEAGMEAEAHHHSIASWDGEEAGPARFHRVGRRRTPTNCSRRRRSTSIPMATAAAILRAEGSHTLEKFINGVARDIEDPETKLTVWKRLQAERLARAPKARRRTGRKRAPAPTCASERSARARITPRSWIIWASPRSTWASAARIRAASTTPSTTISTGTRTSPTPISSTAARWRRPPAPR